MINNMLNKLFLVKRLFNTATITSNLIPGIVKLYLISTKLPLSEQYSNQIKLIKRCYSEGSGGLRERAGKSIRPGANIVIDGAPHRVTKIVQGKRGKGGGFVRATVKNLINGNCFEKTYTSDEVVEHADLEKETYLYSWKDSDNFTFLNNTTFEEIQLSVNDVEEDIRDLLLEGSDIRLVKFNNKVIGVEMPTTAEYDVVSVDERKASGVNHAVVLNSGAEIMVPNFIGVGTRIKINIYERSYIERVSK